MLPSRNGSVIMPDCRFLTAIQAQVLHDYLEQGGRLLAIGELGVNLPADARRALLEHQRTSVVSADRDFRPGDLAVAPQARVEGATNLAINIQRVASGAAIHLIRYDYDQAIDRVPVLPYLRLDVHLAERFGSIAAYSPSGPIEASLAVEGGIHRIELRDVPLYAIVSLSPMSA
jgi:hypothetical protein